MSGFNVLDKLTNEELEVIVKLIVEKGWQTESLSKDKDYKKYYPDHKKYVDKIKNELSLMGGDTIANFARSILGKKSSVSYREMLKDVCKKMDIEYEESTVDDELEKDLLATIVKRAYDNLPEKEQNILWKLLKDEAPTTNKNNLFYNIYADNMGKAYLLSTLVANVLCKTFVGKKLSFIDDIKPPEELDLLEESISTAIMGIKTLVKVHNESRKISLIPILDTISTAKEITGPAYRVVLPAMVYIAAMNQIKNNNISEKKSIFSNFF